MQCLNQSDAVDMIVVDTFAGYEELVRRISGTGVYRKVYAVKAKKFITVNSFNEKMDKTKFLLFYNTGVERLLGTHLDAYGQLYFNSEWLFAYNVASILRANNKNCKLFKFEEGTSSYVIKGSISRTSERLVKLRNLIAPRRTSLAYNGFYVLDPDLLLFNYEYPIIKIDRSIVDTKSYRDFIISVFLTDHVAEKYNKKFILFEENYAADGYNVNDLEIFEKIIDVIGAQNVLVKLHPRAVEDRFERFGVEVRRSEGIPWEAILMSEKCKPSTSLALISGSVINARLLLGASHKAILLYKCLNKRSPIMNEDLDKFLEKLTTKYSGDIIIPESLEKALAILQNQIHFSER
jgi:hypothetical protein